MLGLFGKKDIKGTQKLNGLIKVKMKIEFTPDAQKNCELDEIIQPLNGAKQALIYVYVEMLVTNGKGFEYPTCETFVSNGKNTLRHLIEYNICVPRWFETLKFLANKNGLKIKKALILEK
jgi:hypothetical protein